MKTHSTTTLDDHDVLDFSDGTCEHSHLEQNQDTTQNPPSIQRHNMSHDGAENPNVRKNTKDEVTMMLAKTPSESAVFASRLGNIDESVV